VNLVPELADEVYVLAHGGEIVMHGTPLDVFLRVEQLRAANIEPPILAELFERLAERAGQRLAVPGSVEEAAERLAALAAEGQGEGDLDELPDSDQRGLG